MVQDSQERPPSSAPSRHAIILHLWPNFPSSHVEVSCGGTHSVALTRDGRMFSFGRGDHGRLGYGRKVTTGHPSEVPINIPPPSDVSSHEGGRWCAKLVACGGRHTMAIVEWQTFESE